MRNIRLLFLLFWRPAAAMSSILDQGSLLFASIAVVVMSLLLQLSLGLRITFTFALAPLLVLAAVYAPATLLFTNLFARLGGLGVVFQRDYSPLLTCTAMAWSAATMPLLLATRTASGPVLIAIAVLDAFYFLALVFFAVRTVFGTENSIAILVVSLSWIPLVLLPFIWAPLSLILRFLTSPFLIFYALYYLRGEFSGLGAGLRSRQHFYRMLEASAVNPHDADAQYQLGLIYQQRRQYGEAIQRFKSAIAIDDAETDAHFQLGRIALAQGRLQDALDEFRIVINQNEKHSSSEILRELGELYVAAKQFNDALEKLQIYVERREYDPEGLYFYGFTLQQLGRLGEARQMYNRAVEAARTAPHFRRRYVAQWSRLAQKQLRSLPKT
ncbi:MAG TPA: tetratricopeptide repeat protein [Bryobacteraceae bacterium]|nr:tetratricopeptide repeat protein [Bryobacteraceae bacterium]